ncbi:transposase family protein, partial [Pseudomonas sp. 2822-15]|uniref:transposase family protein n=1 Tax=Pseudomonas sp. 2822-15 TaxID=1712677 RepID=UPI00117A594F
MYYNTIISLLGIKDKHVEIYDSGEETQYFWFELHTKVKLHKCPHCKEKTKRVHDYRWQKLEGSRVAGKKVELHLRKRRYRCVGCSRSFNEKLSFVQRYQR